MSSDRQILLYMACRVPAQISLAVLLSQPPFKDQPPGLVMGCLHLTVAIQLLAVLLRVAGVRFSYRCFPCFRAPEVHAYMLPDNSGPVRNDRVNNTSSPFLHRPDVRGDTPRNAYGLRLRPVSDLRASRPL